MRILINAAAAKMGGAGNYIRTLAGELAEAGEHEYLFLVPEAQAAAIRGLAPHIRVLATNIAEHPFPRRLWFDQVELPRLLRREHIDVLFSTANFATFFCPCRQLLLVRNALYFSRYYRSRFVSRLHWRARADYGVRRWLVQQSAKWADVIMTPSKSMLEECQSQIGGSTKFHVNPYGVALERFRRRPAAGSWSEGPIRLLHVSHYADHKNLGVMFRALGLLCDWGMVNFCLSTTANIDDPRYTVSLSRTADRTALSREAVRSRVYSLGDVDYESIPPLYRSHDLFIFPSVVESYGHPLVEAMASCLPVIAADIAVCHELCGDAAVYFRPESAEDLAHKIQQLAGDPGRRRQLGEAGYMRAKDMRWQAHVDRLLNIFQEMYSGHRMVC